MDGALSTAEKVGGQYLPSPPSVQHQQFGHSWHPQMLHPPGWGLSPKALPHVPLAHKPTQSSSVRLRCLVHRKRPSQLPDPIPAQLERRLKEPAASIPSTCPALQTCHAPPAPEPHNHPANPVNPAAPLSQQGRQRAALPTMIPGEVTALITKHWLRQTTGLSRLR